MDKSISIKYCIFIIFLILPAEILHGAGYIKLPAGKKYEIQNDSVKLFEQESFLRELENDRLKGGRTARWYYGWVIFKNFPLKKKIFGGGFEYLGLFGNKFGEAEIDYPHNPIISAFLYSGLFGGSLYIIFILLVFWLYIKYLKHHFYFFMCFMIVFVFSIVSANSHFSIPIFAVLCIIPFLTKYIVDGDSNKENKFQN